MKLSGYCFYMNTNIYGEVLKSALVYQNLETIPKEIQLQIAFFSYFEVYLKVEFPITKTDI